MAFSVAAFADDAPTPPPTGTTAPAQTNDASTSPDLDQIICRQMDPATGTRIGVRRVCRTKRQWDDTSRTERDDLSRKEFQRGMNSADGT